MWGLNGVEARCKLQTWGMGLGIGHVSRNQWQKGREWFREPRLFCPSETRMATPHETTKIRSSQWNRPVWGAWIQQTVFFVGTLPVNEHSWLVVWNIFIFFHISEMSSSQLTKSYFSEGLKPPTNHIAFKRISRGKTSLNGSSSIFHGPNGTRLREIYQFPNPRISSRPNLTTMGL